MAELVKHLAQSWIGTASKSGSVFGRRQQCMASAGTGSLLEMLEGLMQGAHRDLVNICTGIRGRRLPLR